MLLHRIMDWVLNNRVLLALQDALVSPVLMRLPAKRYEAVRYDKNLFFKMFGIGAGTLACRHLENNKVELSLRYACEIVANQGYKFYSQDWKTYLLYVGLVHAHRKDYERASLWLADGFSRQHSRIANAVNAQSYPDVFVQWLNDNSQLLTSAEGWQQLFAQSADESDAELLLIYICICIFALQLTDLVLAFFDNCPLDHHSDWQKMIAWRQSDLVRSRPTEELVEHELWQGSYPDVSQKLAANVLHRTISTNSSTDRRQDEGLEVLAGMEGYEQLAHELFPVVTNACHHLAQSDYSAALALLEVVVERHADELQSVSSRPGPTKLFLAGFGWSGSSAVHDACRAYPHTRDMPGAGDLPALNVGADSEPMLHQGAGALNELVQAISKNGKITAPVLRRFFKNQVLLMPPFEYIEYKTVNATRTIIAELGLDHYYLLVCRFLFDYASAMVSGDTAQAIAAAEALQENIVNSLFADDDIVFFNNSIFAHSAKIMENVRGRSYFIVVNRDMSDQFCDQMRSNRNFNATFLEFYLIKLNRILAYKRAKSSSRNQGVEFIDINFESWVRDASLREEIARKICGSYDSALESRYFDAEKSGRNINISTEDMGSFDKACLGVFRKVGLSI